MGINLQKGQKVAVGHTNLTIGLGWSPNSGGADFDLDCSVFVVNDLKKILTEEHFIYYGNTKTPDGGVIHSGDNRTGAGAGDDETVKVDVTKLDPAIKELIFVVTIHKAGERNQNFGQVRDSYIRVINNADGAELMKFDLNEDYSIEKSVEFGRLYLKDGQWKFDAMGVGYNEELEFFVSKYFDGPFEK